MAARLARVILLVRDVGATAAFFRDGLGLAAETVGATYARMRSRNGDHGGNVVIDLALAER